MSKFCPCLNNESSAPAFSVVVSVQQTLIILSLLQDKNLSSGIFFLELLSAVEPRVVNWKVVSKGVDGAFLVHK